ncbi:MAG: diadenylate cyclase [Verrucomicrobiales bacterium]
MKFSSEGREGKAIGTIFVLGDIDDVEKNTHQLILNPLQGHPQRSRSIHNPEFIETIRELAALDGAFLIDRRGNVARAAAYLDAPLNKKVKVSRGLGARHTAAAAISAKASCLGIVISESSGTVSVFSQGLLVLEMERAKK